MDAGADDACAHQPDVVLAAGVAARGQVTVIREHEETSVGAGGGEQAVGEGICLARRCGIFGGCAAMAVAGDIDATEVDEDQTSLRCHGRGCDVLEARLPGAGLLGPELVSRRLRLGKAERVNQIGVLVARGEGVGDPGR